MKKLDEIKVWDDAQRKRDHVIAIQLLISQQLDVYAKLMENHSDFVLSPTSYNACIGLLEQLKLHSYAAFTESSGVAPDITGVSDSPLISIIHGA